jgi:hypothetical protein
MSKPLNIQIIERARALISDEQNWCCGRMAEDVNGAQVCPTAARAKKRCALGAFIAAAYEFSNDRTVAIDLAESAVRSFAAPTTLVNVNDVLGHAEVLSRLDKALAAS